jgi:hypothetical protein
MSKSEIQLHELVKNKAEHVDFLFHLLTERQHSISHTSMPNFEEHQQFIDNHPYRAWLLVKQNGAYIGSAYLQIDNSIGINFLPEYYGAIGAVVQLLQSQFTPLPALKSVRNAKFHVHVPAADKELEKALEALDANKLQTTYLLKEV